MVGIHLLTLVAGRQGGVTPILIDAATGDSVGMLKTIRSAKENPEALWTITAPTIWFGTGNKSVVGLIRPQAI